MSLAEELADQLARDVLEAADLMGEADLPADIARLIGASSQSYEEAFLTSLRVLRANAQARALLNERLRAFEARLKAGET